MIARLRSEWAALGSHERTELRVVGLLAALVFPALVFDPAAPVGGSTVSIPVQVAHERPLLLARHVGSIAELEAVADTVVEPAPGWRDTAAFWTLWDVFGTTPKLWKYPAFARLDDRTPSAAEWSAAAYRIGRAARELDEFLRKYTRFRLVVGYRAVGVVAHENAIAAAGEPEWWWVRAPNAPTPAIPLDKLLSDIRLGATGIRLGDLAAVSGKRPDVDRPNERALWDAGAAAIERALLSHLPPVKPAWTEFDVPARDVGGYRLTSRRGDAGQWEPPPREPTTDDEIDVEFEERRR